MRAAAAILLIPVWMFSGPAWPAGVHGTAVQLAQAGSSERGALFRGPSFSRSDSLDKQREFLRKQGYTDADLIELRARDSSDRSWQARIARADRLVQAGDHHAAVKLYDEVLAALHPTHLLARQKVLQDKYLAYQRLGYRGSRIDDLRWHLAETQQRICTIEARGYARMPGQENRARQERAALCLRQLAARRPAAEPRPSEPTGRCRAENATRVSAGARWLFDLACAENLRFERKARHPFIGLTRYIKDEDGTVALVRTGSEVTLFRTLKRRLVDAKQSAPIEIGELFRLSLAATLEDLRGVRSTKPTVINILDVTLTAHNVARLLARPEQWSRDYPKMANGQDRRQNDSAHAILEDLIGLRSVDASPTLFDRLQGVRRIPGADPRAGSKSRALRPKFEESRVIHAFFGNPGVFAFDQHANSANSVNDGYPAHWNGGIHYYYWLGSLIQWIGSEATGGWGGGYVASTGAYYYERAQKSLLGGGLRGKTQLQRGLNRGVGAMNELIRHLDELQKLDERFFAK
ncbi:MAG: hypothetical protein R3E48_00305 [Burkholderiaceae bacterium]